MLKKCALILALALACVLGTANNARASDYDYYAYYDYSACKEYAMDCYSSSKSYYSYACYYYCYYACYYAYCAWYYDSYGDHDTSKMCKSYHYACGYCGYLYSCYDYDYDYDNYKKMNKDKECVYCMYYSYYGWYCSYMSTMGY